MSRWRSAYCGQCGRFLKGVTATIKGFGGDDRLDRVFGDCTVHGRVDAQVAEGWSWEDFFPDDR